MSTYQKTRSTLAIDAVAQAAAQGAARGPLTAVKVNAIAGLAGFVLRLFRRSVSGKDAGISPESRPNLSEAHGPAPGVRRRRMRLAPPRVRRPRRGWSARPVTKGGRSHG